MASCARSAIDKPVDERAGGRLHWEPSPLGRSSKCQGRKIDGWGSSVLGTAGMVRLGLALPDRRFAQ
jgi:hypothetical protein